MSNNDVNICSLATPSVDAVKGAVEIAVIIAVTLHRQRHEIKVSACYSSSIVKILTNVVLYHCFTS